MNMKGPEPLIVYERLRRHFGFQKWWPGETDFEVFVGAILTQQTSWKNAEKALANLKKNDSLTIEKIAKMPIAKLQRLIRPSGFYMQKAGRLKSLCSTILKEQGSLERLFTMDTDELRGILLSYNGIGKETADSIILYASHKPVFVIDAYTKRAMHRINPSISENIAYDELKSYFEVRIGKQLQLYKDFHAQFVELGKSYCRKKPLCTDCPLSDMCSFGIAETNRNP